MLDPNWNGFPSPDAAAVGTLPNWKGVLLTAPPNSGAAAGAAAGADRALAGAPKTNDDADEAADTGVADCPNEGSLASLAPNDGSLGGSCVAPNDGSLGVSWAVPKEGSFEVSLPNVGVLASKDGSFAG